MRYLQASRCFAKWRMAVLCVWLFICNPQLPLAEGFCFSLARVSVRYDLWNVLPILVCQPELQHSTKNGFYQYTESHLMDDYWNYCGNHETSFVFCEAKLQLLHHKRACHSWILYGTTNKCWRFVLVKTWPFFNHSFIYIIQKFTSI